MHSAAHEFPSSPLPRRSVNRGTKKGRCPQGPLVNVLAVAQDAGAAGRGAYADAEHLVDGGPAEVVAGDNVARPGRGASDTVPLLPSFLSTPPIIVAARGR